MAAPTTAQVAPPTLSLRDQRTFADDRARGRRIPDRDNDTEPAARVVAAIVALGNVGGDVTLHDHGPEVVADQPAERELALLGISRDRPCKIARAESHKTELPFAELLRRRQVDVDEVRIAAVEYERCRAG